MFIEVIIAVFFFIYKFLGSVLRIFSGFSSISFRISHFLQNYDRDFEKVFLHLIKLTDMKNEKWKEFVVVQSFDQIDKYEN